MLGEMTSELYRYRGLLGMLAWRDIRVRYKQSLLGITWAFIMPLVQTLVLFTIFSFGPMRVNQLPPEYLKNMPYLLFVMSGVVIWGLFAGTIASSMESLTRNSRLVTKIYFPREVFPLSSMMGSLVDFGIALLMWIPFYIYFAIKGQVSPGPMLLFLPVVLLILLMFIAGLSLLLSMANLFFRDVKYVMTVVLQLWFFATNIAYPINFNNYPQLKWVIALNPMIPIIDAFRDCVRGTPLTNPMGLVVSAIIALLVFFVGWRVFHQAAFKFPEWV